MDARKLVGMTQGARKRAARRKTDGIYLLDTNGLDTYMDDWRALRAKHGAQYMIGSRLSKLPTTHQCENCNASWSNEDDGLATSDGIFCNGHGVVHVNDARARKVRR